MFQARFANQDVTAPGLRPARAAVRCLRRGIKIASMPLVSRSSPLCLHKTPEQQPCCGQAPHQGHRVAPLPVRADIGDPQSAAVRAVPSELVVQLFQLFSGVLAEFHRNGFYFC